MSIFQMLLINQKRTEHSNWFLFWKHSAERMGIGGPSPFGSVGSVVEEREVACGWWWKGREQQDEAKIKPLPLLQYFCLERM
jgi:hypothetical protein